MRFRIVLLLLCVGSTSLVTNADNIRKGPKLIRGGDHGVGTLVSDVDFQNLAGESSNLAQLASEHRFVVIALTSTSCPLSEKYLPTLQEISKQYADDSVHFILLNSVAEDDVSDMQEAQSNLGNSGTYVFDEAGKFAQQIGAVSTTDVIVIDASRTVVYHGAVDDQFGFGYSRDEPKEKHLVAALDALLRNQTPIVEATAAPGCGLNIRRRRSKSSDVTYHSRISRLMNRHCVRCHREDGVGPFALDTFDDVVAHAPMIREVVDRGVMPPWFAATESHSAVSAWANDASLSPTEKRELMTWLEGDQSLGDPADEPATLTFANSWTIGQPDVVFEFPKAVPIPATGVMPYEHVIIDNELSEDKWVQAIEVIAGEPSVVHHVLVYIIHTGQPIRNPLNYWAVYAPGQRAQIYPDGYARKLPKGTRIVMQMHYTPNGTATEDKSRIGLRFADAPPKHEVKTASVINGRFEIPPGAKKHKIEADLKMPVDVEILGLLPHSHLRGVAARYELISPSGASEMLLDVPDYDFNWQLYYEYAKRPVFPKDSVIHYTAWYDNSEDNPANPDPTATVRWGEQTSEEMHLGYVEYAEPVGGSWAGQYEGLREKLIKEFADLDSDKSGEISDEEFPDVVPDWAPAPPSARQLRGLFRLIDLDQSGGLSENEFNLIRDRFR